MDPSSIDWKYLYTSFEGRIPRMQYWIGAIVLGVVSVIIQLILGRISAVLALLVSLIFLYPGYALLVKRGYDRERPEIIVQVFLGFAVLANVLTVFLGPTNGISTVVNVVFLIAALGIFIDFGCMRGTVGNNRYGPDPLAGRA